MERTRSVERQWLTRLRWRMRGAWLWPAFFAITLLDGIVLAVLPFYGEGPGGLVPGLLIAGFANLFCVAVLAPYVGRRLVRRRRPDIPKAIADNYAGTAFICAVAVLLVVGGIVHRPAVQGEERDRAATYAAVHSYVTASAPEYRSGLATVDAIRLQPDYYRACVPGADPSRWLCLFVGTDQEPPSITLDTDKAPNRVYQQHGGFS